MAFNIVKTYMAHLDEFYGKITEYDSDEEKNNNQSVRSMPMRPSHHIQKTARHLMPETKPNSKTDMRMLESRLSSQKQSHNLYLDYNNINGIELFNRTGGVVSPLSILMVMILCMKGAKGNTLKQLLNTFNVTNVNQIIKSFADVYINLKQDGCIQLNNGFFIQDSLHINENYYQFANLFGITRNLDIASSINILNTWVSNNTNELIKEFLDPRSDYSDIRMVIINTLYFKSNWSKPFNKSRTTKKPFGNKKVYMMSVSGNFKYYEDSMMQCIDMKYEDDDYSMIVILPRTSLKDFEMDHNMYQFILDKMTMQEGNISMPKFEQRNKIDLTGTLQKMGLVDLFNDIKCDLSDISPKVYANKLIHEVVVIVDEEKTEAAAATNMIMSYNSVPKSEFQFYADHPFIYIIRKGELILFIGTYSG
jgi:serine protease inhibitor